MASIERLVEADAVRRLRERDPSLFTTDIDQKVAVAQRLGWTDLAEKAPSRLPLLTSLAGQLEAEGARDVVLLGMGGSSLAPLVFSRVLGSAPGHPALHVLDTSSPTQLSELLARLDAGTTFFILASKSGTTTEPLSLYAVFRQWADAELGRLAAGKRFLVITDPGTPLEKRRSREGMRVTVTAPSAVGGRFSALSVFGLLPAALIGVDLETVVRRAHAMEQACARPAEDNPGAALAAWMVDAAEAGRDKLTLVAPQRLAPFGLWAEQLVAESLGKHGKGIVPVPESPRTPTGYGQDRAVVVLRTADDTETDAWAHAVAAETPVLQLILGDVLDVGAEFVRWENGVALAGFLLGVNPFDEPNVAEAKKATEAVLADGTDVPQALADLGGVWVTYAGDLDPPADGAPGALDDAVRPLAGSLALGDYFAMLAYLPEDERYLAPLRNALAAVSAATGHATVLDLGPRYLHSSGQLHKGGPDTGVFLLLTVRDRDDVSIPGQRYTLAALHRAQAEGDLVALAAHGRRVLRLDLPFLDQEIIAAVANALTGALG
ncbi:MAG: glucose-6-phosphate isomerase [Coriobacteriia bacterium]|nr:glucose-6-phosphate isomerase [Coriobacteriia bacterium]